MLELRLKATELFDEEHNIFINLPEATVQLEHSLSAVSKWESKWEKPFLVAGDKTTEETLSYIECMIISDEVPQLFHYRLSEDQCAEINRYISSEQTATRVPDSKQRGGDKEPVTSELIYYWMIMLNIPFECDQWHLSRLLTLIRVCGIKNSPPKKMSAKEIAERNRKLNAERRKQYGTNG